MPTKPKSRLFGAAGNPVLARKGGSVTAAQSRPKAKALKALHASRRGRRLNATGLTMRELDDLMGSVSTLIRRKSSKGVISIRAAAQACSVSDRTVRRWLQGVHWPHSAYVQRLQAWLRRVSTGG